MLLAEQSRDEENQETSAVICKCQNARMPEKSQSGIGITSGSQLLPSGIGIPTSGFSPVQTSSALHSWKLHIEVKHSTK